MILRRGLMVLAILIGVAVVGVVPHDVYCNGQVAAGSLCERSDGSHWRDPSNGCSGGEDPRCDEGKGCAASAFAAEPAKTSCAWVMHKDERPAQKARPPME